MRTTQLASLALVTFLTACNDGGSDFSNGSGAKTRKTPASTPTITSTDSALPPPPMPPDGGDITLVSSSSQGLPQCSAPGATGPTAFLQEGWYKTVKGPGNGPWRLRLSFVGGCVSEGGESRVELAIRYEDCNGLGAAGDDVTKIITATELAKGAELSSEIPTACASVAIRLVDGDAVSLAGVATKIEASH